MKWALEHGAPIDWQTPCFAGGAGHLHILEWLLEANHFSIVDSQTCAETALGGHFNIVKWLWRHDVEWDVSTCACAAQRAPGVVADEGLPVGHRDVRDGRPLRTRPRVGVGGRTEPPG